MHTRLLTLWLLLFSISGVAMSAEDSPAAEDSNKEWKPKLQLQNYRLSYTNHNMWKIEDGRECTSAVNQFNLCFEVYSPNRKLILAGGEGSILKQVLDGTGSNLLTDKTKVFFESDRNRRFEDGTAHMGTFSIEGLREPAPDGRAVTSLEGDLSILAAEENEVAELLLKPSNELLNNPVFVANQIKLTAQSVSERSITFRMEPGLIDFERLMKFALTDSSGNVLSDLRVKGILVKDDHLEFTIPFPQALAPGASFRLSYPKSLRKITIPVRFSSSGKFTAGQPPVKENTPVSLTPLAARATNNYQFVPVGCEILTAWKSVYNGTEWRLREETNAEASVAIAANTPEGVYFSADDTNRREDLVDLKITDDKGRNLLRDSTDFGSDSPRVRLFAKGKKYIAAFTVRLRVPEDDAKTLSLRGQVSLLGTPGTQQVEFSNAEVVDGAKLKLSDDCFLHIVKKTKNDFTFQSDLKPAQNGRIEVLDEKSNRLEYCLMNGQSSISCPEKASRIRILFQTQNIAFSLPDFRLPVRAP